MEMHYGSFPTFTAWELSPLLLSPRTEVDKDANKDINSLSVQSYPLLRSAIFGILPSPKAFDPFLHFALRVPVPLSLNSLHRGIFIRTGILLDISEFFQHLSHSSAFWSLHMPEWVAVLFLFHALITGTWNLLLFTVILAIFNLLNSRRESLSFGVHLGNCCTGFHLLSETMKAFVNQNDIKWGSN